MSVGESILYAKKFTKETKNTPANGRSGNETLGMVYSTWRTHSAYLSFFIIIGISYAQRINWIAKIQ